MASTAGERKEKGVWEPSEDQYVRTGGPASHVKNPDPAPAPRPPTPHAPLSPASLTDKPLGASGRGTEAEEGGLQCVYVWVHVYLHGVCQQVSRGAGMSANSRSTWDTHSTDAHRHTHTRALTTPQIRPLLML